MSRPVATLIWISCVIAPAFSLVTAQAQPEASSADVPLRALYTEEWNWRGKELGRGANDRFARVDEASQQGRLEYWTKALATLDTIPFDQLSTEEKINAQNFRTSLRALVSDIKYRTYEAPFNSDTFFWTGFTPRQFGWTRDQAMSYLRDRAALAEHEITTEIDRYIAWPGQALAYKLGEIQIRRHRREAEEKLGAKLDQRRFHDAILAIGSVPLPVLEQRMTQFIAEESAATTTPPR